MSENDPEDFAEMLRRMLSGQGGDSVPDLSALNLDPAVLGALFGQLQGAFAADPWETALRQALHIANKDGQALDSASRSSLAEALDLADLWLSEATTISALSEPARPMTRGEWVEQSMPAWKEIATPVSTSIADALIAALDEQAPEEMRGLIDGAGTLMRGLGGTLFAAQLGQVIGNLSLEVTCSGDVGIPVLPAGTAAVIPQNIAAFGAGLEIGDDEIALYLAARELAFARLYRHAKWLRLHVMGQITDFGRGVSIDMAALEDVASRFDPSDPEELRIAIEGGALLPEQSEAQSEALDRLENLVATIEGWVEVVTAQATSRLPSAARLVETTRRRRAAGGPAEDALAALVGLKIRPRRLREAAAMWQAITDAVGVEARDALWDYPDLMPAAGDIDDPTALIERLRARARGEEPLLDAVDEALAKLLEGEEPPSAG